MNGCIIVHILRSCSEMWSLNKLKLDSCDKFTHVFSIASLAQGHTYVCPGASKDVIAPVG